MKVPSNTHLHCQWSNRIMVFKKTDLLEGVAAHGDSWQLVVGKVEAIDVLKDEKTFRVEDDERREGKTENSFLGNDPEKTSDEEKNES